MTERAGDGDELRGAERYGWRDAPAILTILSVGALALAQSWGRWLHPIIDAGRDLYVPEQLASGASLYRDILYFYPPLAPYLLVLATAVAGRSLASYTAIGVMVSTVVAATLYMNARRLIGRDAAFSVTLLFVAVSFTGATAYGCNFIFPYAHAAIFAMAFFLIYAGAIVRLFVLGATRARLVTTLLFALLSAWCKIEFAAFALATLGLATVLAWLTRRVPGKTLALSMAIAAGAGAGTFAAVSVWFGGAGEGHRWLYDNVLPQSLLAGPVARAFYAKVTGSDHWIFNLAQAIAGALICLAYLWLVRLIDRRGLRADSRGPNAVVALLLVALSVVVFYLANDRFFRAWTVLQVALLPWAARDVVAVLRSADERRWQSLQMPLFLWFSICGTSRIYLNLAPVWYGFFLILPLWLLIADVVFRYLPLRGIYSRRAALLWLPLFVVIAGRNLAEQREAYAAKRFPIVTQRGVFFDASEERARVLNEFLGYAKQSGIRELVLIPEGLAINYAAQIPNPMSWHTFTPAEIPSVEIERRAIAEFERVKPHHVAINTQTAAAFGFQGFGVDYGLEIAKYLRQHYALEQEWRTETFSMFLLKREVEGN